MPVIDLDFGKVGKIPPEGTYRFTVAKAQVKLNKAKDGRYINLQASLTDSPDEDFENHTVWDIGSLKKAGLWRTKDMLEAITQDSWEEDGMSLETNDENELEFLKDETFMAFCVHELDNNEKPVLKIKTYYPDDGSVEIEIASEVEEESYEENE